MEYNFGISSRSGDTIKYIVLFLNILKVLSKFRRFIFPWLMNYCLSGVDTTEFEIKNISFTLQEK